MLFYNSKDKFDILISYFALNTIGLGKYGEQISLNADFDTLCLINCMLEPDGLLYLAVNVDYNQESSSIQFNTKRIFGKQRLAKLFDKNWIILKSLFYNFGKNQLFIMQKIN